MVWPALIVLVAAETAYEVSGARGHDILFVNVIHDAVLVGAAVVCLLAARLDVRWRPVAIAFGAGLAAWAAGDVLWSILYAQEAQPPYPSAPDAFWLAWYPLTALGIALLIRHQVAGFHMHRWLDGLALMLIVLTPCAAILLQPAIEQTTASTAATVTTFAYPVLDTLLIGAVLGVYGLTGWHPGRTWLLLGLGCIIMAVGDGLFAVQQARNAYVDGRYDFVWPIGALLIAYAMWRPSYPARLDAPIVGWRVIILPVFAQALAIGVQVYGLFHHLGNSERIITIIVLVVAMVQIIVARPRGSEEA
jgi:hypothetical protein